MQEKFDNNLIKLQNYLQKKYENFEKTLKKSKSFLLGLGF